jgi:hypothetical protein
MIGFINLAYCPQHSNAAGEHWLDAAEPARRFPRLANHDPRAPHLAARRRLPARRDRQHRNDIGTVRRSKSDPIRPTG